MARQAISAADCAFAFAPQGLWSVNVIREAAMTAETSAPTGDASARHGRAPRWLLILEGVALVLLGLVSAIAPFAATIAVTLVVGWVLLLAGVIRLVSSLTHRGPGWGWALLSALVSVVVGVLLLARPVAGAYSLTLLLAAYFLAHALLSFARAISHRGARPWAILSGVADLILWVIVLMGLWVGALWMLGLLVAVNLAFAGATLIVLGAAGPKALAPAS